MRRRWRYLAILIAVFGAWLAVKYFELDAPATRSADGQSIVVRDGDTLTVGDSDVRLYGIDAPEYRQSCKDAAGKDWPCGIGARTALVALVKGHTITCEEMARDHYQRVVARCTDETGNDLSAAMATQGLAISPGHFETPGPYSAEADAAKNDKRGIWAGTFDVPAVYRGEHSRHTNTLTP